MVLFLFLLLSVLAVNAQKTSEEAGDSLSFLEMRKCRSSFTSTPLQEESIAAIQQFVLSSLSTNHALETAIDVHYVQQSPGGRHYSFFQTIGNTKVYNSELKVNTNGNGVITSFFNNSFAPKTLEKSILPFALIVNQLKQEFKDFEVLQHELVWFPVSEELLVKAYRIELRKTVSENIELITNGKEILHLRDINMYLTPPDSTAKGYVFLPDPLTSSGNLYGGSFIDNNDADAQWLTNERKEVSLTVDYSNNLFQLKNAFIQIADFDLPTNAPATAVTPMFNYTRSNLNFEQVNAFYHITEMGKRMQQLGFNCANTLVEADANALNGQDNSFFATNYSPMRLFFGGGGVDDAEDADVCIHEYSHFLSYNASPQSNTGNQRLALDEAFGDYNAASYSRWHNDFYWGWVYNWDGHNSYWAGRVVNSTKKYPTNLSNNIYKDGEIWSSMLMQLWSDIGKDVTDKLLVQTHYSYAQNIQFTDAASLLLKADQQLYNNMHYCIIAQRMYERGVLPNGKTLCPTTIADTEKALPIQLLHTPQGCLLTSTETIWNATIAIYDAAGKLLLSQPFEGHNFIANKSFSAGIYFVKVYNNHSFTTLKWFNNN